MKNWKIFKICCNVYINHFCNCILVKDNFSIFLFLKLDYIYYILMTLFKLIVLCWLLSCWISLLRELFIINLCYSYIPIFECIFSLKCWENPLLKFILCSFNNFFLNPYWLILVFFFTDYLFWNCLILI